MIRFCFHPSPNPAKVALFLEEVGLPYEAVPVHAGKRVSDEATKRALFPSNELPAT